MLFCIMQHVFHLLDFHIFHQNIQFILEKNPWLTRFVIRIKVQYKANSKYENSIKI